MEYSLPERTTRGTRSKALSAEALEADQNFWNQDFFQEKDTDDSFTESDETSSESDSTDSDIDLPEDEDEVIPQEPVEKKVKPKRTVYLDPSKSKSQTLKRAKLRLQKNKELLQQLRAKEGLLTSSKEAKELNINKKDTFINNENSIPPSSPVSTVSKPLLSPPSTPIPEDESDLKSMSVSPSETQSLKSTQSLSSSPIKNKKNMNKKVQKGKVVSPARFHGSIIENSTRVLRRSTIRQTEEIEKEDGYSSEEYEDHPQKNRRPHVLRRPTQKQMLKLVVKNEIVNTMSLNRVLEEEALKKKIPVKKQKVLTDFIRVYSSEKCPKVYTYSRMLYCPFITNKPLEYKPLISCISGFPAKYIDPLTLKAYTTVEEFKKIREPINKKKTTVRFNMKKIRQAVDPSAIPAGIAIKPTKAVKQSKTKKKETVLENSKNLGFNNSIVIDSNKIMNTSATPTTIVSSSSVSELEQKGKQDKPKRKYTKRAKVAAASLSTQSTNTNILPTNIISSSSSLSIKDECRQQSINTLISQNINVKQEHSKKNSSLYSLSNSINDDINDYFRTKSNHNNSMNNSMNPVSSSLSIQQMNSALNNVSTPLSSTSISTKKHIKSTFKASTALANSLNNQLNSSYPSSIVIDANKFVKDPLSIQGITKVNSIPSSSSLSSIDQNSVMNNKNTNINQFNSLTNIHIPEEPKKRKYSKPKKQSSSKVTVSASNPIIYDTIQQSSSVSNIKNNNDFSNILSTKTNGLTSTLKSKEIMNNTTNTKTKGKTGKRKTTSNNNYLTSSDIHIDLSQLTLNKNKYTKQNTTLGNSNASTNTLLYPSLSDPK
ncbi:hypothetical protein WA158_004884 [Blastocystis sp. Blastoise]